MDSIPSLKTIEIPIDFLDTALLTMERAIKVVQYTIVLREENKGLAALGGQYKALYEEEKIQLRERESIASDCEEMKKYHMEESAERYKALLKEERKKKMWKMGTVATGGFALGYVLLDRLGLIQ